MKRTLATLLLAALAFAPASGALAQPDRDPNADPPQRGDRPNDRAERPDRGERGERGAEGRGERGDRGERGRGDRAWRLTEDQLDSALEIIDRLNPELAESLRETRADDPALTVRRIAEEFPRVHELLAMRADDPQRYELHMQSIQVMRASVPLIRQLRQAQRDEDQVAIDTLTPQVRDKVEAMFDIRMALRRLEVQELRDRIAELEEQLAQAEEEREEHIDQRTQDVVEGNHPPRGRGGREGERPEPGAGDREDRPRRGDRE